MIRGVCAQCRPLICVGQAAGRFARGEPLVGFVLIGMAFTFPMMYQIVGLFNGAFPASCMNAMLPYKLKMLTEPTRGVAQLLSLLRAVSPSVHSLVFVPVGRLVCSFTDVRCYHRSAPGLSY